MRLPTFWKCFSDRRGEISTILVFTGMAIIALGILVGSQLQNRRINIDPRASSDDIPNCYLSVSSNTVTVGQKLNITGNFHSPGADLRGEIFFNDFSVIKNQYFGLTTKDGTMTAEWTPSTAGTYKVRCRAWNDARAECRPAALVDAPPRYACAGPNAEVSIQVNPAPTTPTVSPSAVCVPTQSSPINNTILTSTPPTLSWGGVNWSGSGCSIPTHYKVTVNGGGIAWESLAQTATSYTMNGFTFRPGTTYTWSVRGCSNSSCSTMSAWAPNQTFRTATPTATPVRCPVGQLACIANTCIDVTRNSQHCGACGRVCATSQVCSNSVCIAKTPTPTPTRAITNTPTPRPVTLCTPVHSSPINNVILTSTPPTLMWGVYVTGCTRPSHYKVTVNGGGIAWESLPQTAFSYTMNGFTFRPGSTYTWSIIGCSNASCTTTSARSTNQTFRTAGTTATLTPTATPVRCPVGQLACTANTCIDVTRNSQHCGACGRVCATSQVCSNSVCVAKTPTPRPPMVPVISLVSWTPNKPVVGGKVQVVVEGTDGDSSQVAVEVHVTGSGYGDQIVASSRTVPVTSGKWSYRPQIGVPGIVGTFTGYVIVKDATNSTRSTNYTITVVTPTPTSVLCSRRPAGDSNCDGNVDILDYTCWRSRFITGVELANCKNSDYDGRDSVNILDFTIWKNTFLREQGR